MTMMMVSDDFDESNYLDHSDYSGCYDRFSYPCSRFELVVGMHRSLCRGFVGLGVEI